MRYGTLQGAEAISDWSRGELAKAPGYLGQSESNPRSRSRDGFGSLLFPFLDGTYHVCEQ